MQVVGPEPHKRHCLATGNSMGKFMKVVISKKPRYTTKLRCKDFVYR